VFFEVGLYPIRDNSSGKDRITGVACFSEDITDGINHVKAIEVQNEKLKNIAWTPSRMVRAPEARIMRLTDLMKY
jgi:hypothetical protein